MSSKLKVLIPFLIPLTVNLFPAKAFAEMFTVFENMSLNTNEQFRKINGQPRMSIYLTNDNDTDQKLERINGNRGGTLLKHDSTGKCLNATDLSNGSELNVSPCDANNPNQNFVISDIGNGHVEIKLANTNLCVDAPIGENEGIVHLWECFGNVNQRWKTTTFPTTQPPSNPEGTPLLQQQGAQYFKDRPQFYIAGNIFAQSAYGSSLVNNTGSTEGNCTWYAYGRLKELGGNVNALNSMSGNANQWHEQLSNGTTIVDSNNVQFGDIAQWTRDGMNHVAVVERVYTENGVKKIRVSESHYSTSFDGGGAGTLHRIYDYTANNPDRYIRVPRT